MPGASPVLTRLGRALPHPHHCRKGHTVQTVPSGQAGRWGVAGPLRGGHPHLLCCHLGCLPHPCFLGKGRHCHYPGVGQWGNRGLRPAKLLQDSPAQPSTLTRLGPLRAFQAGVLWPGAEPLTGPLPSACPGPIPRECELCPWGPRAHLHPAPAEEQVRRALGRPQPRLQLPGPTSPPVRLPGGRQGPGCHSGSLPGTWWVRATQRPTRPPTALR